MFYTSDPTNFKKPEGFEDWEIKGFDSTEYLQKRLNELGVSEEENKIELLEGMDPEGVIATFISKKGEGLRHIAFGVENLDERIATLKNEGFEFINEVPKRGADNKMIVFLHPKCTNGVLVELCQEIK